MTHRPYCLCFSITYKCNMNCIMCSVDDAYNTRKSTPTLGITQIKNMLEQSRVIGCIKKVIISGGEPSLSPLLPETLQHAKRLDFQVQLVSNIYSEGFSSFDDILSYLADSSDELMFSYDSIHSTEMNLIRGRDVYGKVTASLDRILKIRKERGYHTTLISSTVLQPENVKSIFDTLGLLLSKGVDQCHIQPRHFYSCVTLENFARQSPPPYGWLQRRALLRTVGRLCELAAKDSRIVLPDSNYDNWLKFFTKPTSIEGPCRSRNYIFINPYGEMFGCGFGPPLPELNIAKTSLAEYLESETYAQVVKMASLCKICMHGCA